MESLLSLLKGAALTGDDFDAAALSTQLRAFRDAHPGVEETARESQETARQVHRVVLSSLEMLETRVRDAGEYQACSGLDVVVQLMEFLPPELLGRVSVDDHAAGRRQETTIVVEELGDEHGPYLEPIGVRLLLTAALCLDHTSTSHLLTKLVESQSKAVDSCPLLFFLEDIRSRMLSLWKAFHANQSEDAAVTATPPSFETRCLEARRVEGVFGLIKGEMVVDRVVDRLLPCVLFVVDDFDPRVACVGASTLEGILSRATSQSVRDWHHVLQKTICDRLRSAQLVLWSGLLPVTMLLTERCPAQKERLTCRLAVLEAMLERLLTDLAPYELGNVFLNHASVLIERTGRGTVRFFSKLFPLMTQWLFSSTAGLQEKTLDLLVTVIQATQERMARHQQFIQEILTAVEKHAEIDRGSDLAMKIDAVRACLVNVLTPEISADCSFVKCPIEKEH